VIKSFKCKKTKRLFNDEQVREFSAIERVARRKLLMLNGAKALNDLKVPPGNRLHPLHEDREGQHAISINDQSRVCFIWKDDDAYDVEIVIDYH
jgi:proteic killer suppression protein